MLYEQGKSNIDREFGLSSAILSSAGKVARQGGEFRGSSGPKTRTPSADYSQHHHQVLSELYDYSCDYRNWKISIHMRPGDKGIRTHLLETLDSNTLWSRNLVISKTSMDSCPQLVNISLMMASFTDQLWLLANCLLGWSAKTFCRYGKWRGNRCMLWLTCQIHSYTAPRERGGDLTPPYL